MNPSAQPYDRREVHNASVNEQVARQGACAQVHLATGRICGLEHGHRGSCHFVPHDQLRLVPQPQS
jgi:hypothetical protein